MYIGVGYLCELLTYETNMNENHIDREFPIRLIVICYFQFKMC